MADRSTAFIIEANRRIDRYGGGRAAHIADFARWAIAGPLLYLRGILWGGGADVISAHWERQKQ